MSIRIGMDFATLPVGHNHPKLGDEGFRESLKRAALANPFGVETSPI